VTWLTKLSNDEMCDKTTTKELKKLLADFTAVLSKNGDKRQKGKGKVVPYVEVDENDDKEDDEGAI
jgi:hypothetical protein